MRDVAFDTAVRARAPLRIGLCGLHAAIARFAQATQRPLPERTIRIRSLDLDGVGDGGIVAACLRRLSPDADARGHGLELDLATDAPLESGLGAPSALAVVIVGAFASWTGSTSPIARSRTSPTRSSPEPSQRWRPTRPRSAGSTPSSATRAASRSARCRWSPTWSTSWSSAACSCPRPSRRVGPGEPYEGPRALAAEARTALLRGRLDAPGGLLHEDWQRNRSTRQADELYAAARTGGALGGTACGAGSGGFVFLLCPADRRAGVAATLRHLGARVSPVEFTSAGLRSWLQDAREAP